MSIGQTDPTQVRLTPGFGFPAAPRQKTPLLFFSSPHRHSAPIEHLGTP